MLNTREVADYLNINEKQVYKLIKETNIPATRITGKWTFPKKLIDEWIISSAQEHAGMKKNRGVQEEFLVIMGSNDFSMEILSRELTRKFPAYSLSLSSVGSKGGLIALGRGICNMASCHLLDPETGTYNIPYLSRYLPDMEVAVINLVHRDLGLIVRPGNPLHIHGVEDLSKADIKIINRQKGSGTRTFFDFELKQLEIAPGRINGYNTEVNTHTDVAIAVLSGSADTGIAILSAAKMLGLEFIHLTKERFDLVLPRQSLSTAPVNTLLEVIRSEEFKEMIIKLGGYDTAHTGEVITP